MCDQEIIPQACHGWLCGFGILQKNAQLGFVLSCSLAYSEPQPVKFNLNKKLDPNQKIIQALILMTESLEKLEMKILSHGKQD